MRVPFIEMAALTIIVAAFVWLWQEAADVCPVQKGDRVRHTPTGVVGEVRMLHRYARGTSSCTVLVIADDGAVMEKEYGALYEVLNAK